MRIPLRDIKRRAPTKYALIGTRSFIIARESWGAFVKVACLSSWAYRERLPATDFGLPPK